MRTLILGGLLASAMLVPALAQTSPPPAPPDPAVQSTAPKAHAGEMWRSSKLIGLSIYNDQNEKLGDISEILLDKSGKADFVVIGVGGFLGIGQQDIMVEMSKLKFVDEPVRTSSTTTSTTGSATTGTANRPATATTTTTPTTKSKWYPDHAVLSGATKDSLKNMAEFKYD
jgi:sporulation protein YlmC with PRC-barrel domain